VRGGALSTGSASGTCPPSVVGATAALPLRRTRRNARYGLGSERGVGLGQAATWPNV
jgi:hypothetical protein